MMGETGNAEDGMRIGCSNAQRMHLVIMDLGNSPEKSGEIHVLTAWICDIQNARNWLPKWNRLFMGRGGWEKNKTCNQRLMQ